jgi:hypothetical protein
VAIHPLLCRWINGDFDGDQVAIVHPLTEAGQTSVREHISVGGHLRRDPELVKTLVPEDESLWGLALLSTTGDGRRRLEEVLGELPFLPEGYVTAAALAAHMRVYLDREGPEATLATLQSLHALGLQAASESGASLDPFMTVPRGREPLDREQAEEAFAASRDFHDAACGPQLLAVKSGARGKVENLTMLAFSREVSGAWEAAIDSGAPLPGSASAAAVASVTPSHRGGPHTARGHLDGLSEGELLQLALEVRRHFWAMANSLHDVARSYAESQHPAGYGILSRAARARSPGIVVASAAASGELDPLADVDARLFMGLPVEQDP